MTPKEKAIELHNKILDVTYDDRDMPGEPTWVSTRCALIAVDEIIKTGPLKMIDWGEIISDKPFWIEVKQEIERL